MIDLPDFQMIFPDATFPFPYAPGGRMWYSLPDTYSFQSNPDFSSQPEVVKSREVLTEWLRSLESLTGVPLSRTILSGFSQGGAMTLDVGLQLPVAALMVLSGYLHGPVQLGNPFPQKVLMVHGTQDLVVPITAARQARQTLQQLGIEPEYQELTMGHEISLRVLELMQNFTEQIRFEPEETT